MSDALTWIDIAEFRELGFLQEVNRRLLHPAGLALAARSPWSVEELGDLLKVAEIVLDDDALKRLHTVLEYGRWTLAGVRDHRADPEGVVFEDLSSGDDIARADRVDEEIARHTAARMALFDHWVQPVGRTVPLPGAS